jgi:hypothetical protein
VSHRPRLPLVIWLRTRRHHFEDHAQYRSGVLVTKLDWQFLSQGNIDQAADLVLSIEQGLSHFGRGLFLRETA